MRGFPNCRRNELSLFLVSLLTALSLLLAACSSAEEPRRAEGSGETLAKFLAKYERTFHPSAYKLDFKMVKAEEAEHFAALRSATVYTPAVPETVAGFRIQILLTQEIDSANAALANLEEQVPDDYAYMAYDAPYYKIRVGNFTDRTSAGVTLQQLVGLGYREAWIVPDNILKNPPPKLPDYFIEPERYKEHSR